MTKSRDEVAHFFDSIAQELKIIPGNAPEEVYPGYPGVVLADNAIQQMNWGFPLSLRGVKGQMLKPKPVNNARTDKLRTPFWSASFRDRRCLIPMSEFAEAEGPKGAKTRTWFALPGTELFAVAGFWRQTEEWGPAYTMVMTDANKHLEGVHTRMPVILSPEEWPLYLGEDARLAYELCRPYPGDMTIRRTDRPWGQRR